MNKNVLSILAVIIALIAITAPTLFAINQARKQSVDFEMGHMLSYARDVVNRSDETGDQIARGIQKIESTQEKDPCSDKSIAVMRDVDVSSSYIQAIGYVSGDNLICSSLGKDGQKMNLGPVDLVRPNGVKLRINVKLPFESDINFFVLELHHYAAIVHKSLPLDTTTSEKDVSLSVFTSPEKRIISERGYVDPAWINDMGDRQEATFIKDGYVVAIVKSGKYKIGALAALPVSYVDQRVSGAALLLVPAGVLAGLLLAGAIFYLARQQMSMLTALKSALRRNEFFLEYQPVIDLQTGNCVGVEALIRWLQPNGNLIRPDLFIPVAEASGLITLITERVMELVAEDTGNVFQRYPDFHIAINLSPVDLHSERVIDSLLTLLLATKGVEGNLIVEVTERGFMKADVAKDMIQKIRSHGLGVAIDDFGTGYSSLSYLETFELDYLKIDKSFVDSIGTEAATRNVVTHIIEMSKALDLRMIAEGVETEAQAKFLREHGVQFAQGWLYGKPTAFKNIVSMLKQAE